MTDELLELLDLTSIQVILGICSVECYGIKT